MKKAKVKKILCYLFFMLALIFILAPIIVTIVFSFNKSRFSTLPWSGTTLDWYRQIFADSSIWIALRNSVIIGILTSVIASVFGFSASYGMRYMKSKFKNVFYMFSMSAVAIPWTMLGLALLIYYKKLGLNLSVVTVCFSHIILTMPMALNSINGRMKTIPKAMENAAWDLGAGGFKTMWYVILPQTLPGILSAMMLSFTISFDEFIISWFTCGFDTTLPVYIFNVTRSGTKPTINAIGTIVFIVSITMTVLSQILSRKGVDDKYD